MRTILGIILAIVAGCAVHAQSTLSWDQSGNGLLNGTYYFREVFYIVNDAQGNLYDAGSAFGTITFDGAGHYTLNGTLVDGMNGPGSGSTTGTYGIAASGLGSFTSPISNGDAIYGLVTNGIFIGSSTENVNGFNDLFIAAPVSAASNATLNGAYWVADMDFPNGDVTTNRDAWFQLNPDGQGNLGTISAQGYIAGSSTATSQTITGARYAFSNGAANVTLGGTLTNSNLIAGTKVLYISPDGNFIFGGSAMGWDMFVGVRTSGGAASSGVFNGLYYQGGIIEDNSQGFGNLNTFYGSLSAANGSVIDHKRLFSVFNNSALNSTVSDSYPANSSTYDAPDGSAHYAVGAGGAIRVGAGVNPLLGISVAVQAPASSGSGVYISPTGVVNAASSSPFTAGISRGELISIYGSNLAPSFAVASTLPFPTTLNNVQVNINNRPAPIYFVSQSQVAVVVPYATELTFAQIQVINGNTASNTVTVYMNTTEPGIFTNNPVGGLGYAAALHTDYSLVSPSSPAKIGETIAVYLTGLGDVSPTVPDGSAGPSTSFSNTVAPIAVTIDGMPANVTYSGLAPGLAGLYQINVTAPTGVSNGDVYIAVSGPDSFSSEALVTIGAASSAQPLRRATGTSFSGTRTRRDAGYRIRARRNNPVSADDLPPIQRPGALR